MLKKIVLFFLLGLVLVVAGLNIWGWATLGTLYPAPDPVRDPEANRVVMVFGATGSALIRPDPAFRRAGNSVPLRPGSPAAPGLPGDNCRRPGPCNAGNQRPHARIAQWHTDRRR